MSFLDVVRERGANNIHTDAFCAPDGFVCVINMHLTWMKEEEDAFFVLSSPSCSTFSAVTLPHKSFFFSFFPRSLINRKLIWHSTDTPLHHCVFSFLLWKKKKSIISPFFFQLALDVFLVLPTLSFFLPSCSGGSCQSKTQVEPKEKEKLHVARKK